MAFHIERGLSKFTKGPRPVVRHREHQSRAVHAGPDRDFGRTDLAGLANKIGKDLSETVPVHQRFGQNAMQSAHEAPRRVE